MSVTERFLRYIAIHTASDPDSETVPSSARQKNLACLLAEELLALGLSDAHVDENGYVYAHLPARNCDNGVRLGFISHMDTAPDFCGDNVQAQIHSNYDGSDIPLGSSGRVLTKAMFPHLASLAGKTLITTDGTTLLGADDKAGIAEIMTMLEMLQQSDMPHPCLSIAFTPDEEIGASAEHFDLDTFAADFAYTVDGSAPNDIEYENFNAASAHWDINGVNVHPGSAKDTMRNACLVAMEINSLLPAMEIPACTEGYEGFFHLTDMTGDVEKAALDYIVRDHDADRFAGRLDTLRHIEKCINEKYGAGTVALTIQESYRNMAEKIRESFHLVENASAVISSLGMTPSTPPIRGGTDGSRLSFMGLPCPNLGTGGYAFHGPYEHITAEDMETCVRVITGLVTAYAKS
ncbi:MAG: peptidase T [Clostridia bacterium]|nr:peptidase T [Clostridia bacterium]